MAMISPAAATVVAARPAQALGLPQLRVTRAEKLRCAYSKDGKEEAAAATPAVVKGVPLLAAASAAMTAASPALALVDERMSTEGTGLSLGLSNNLLGWILLGVFGLIWSLYTVYSSTLDDDDESGGLSL
ncbi:photosystem II reaction center W protein, chloroplastic-like [Triticum urartu]|nr:photosystem II reaction center W protein, chloroplastic-like [Triticum dicoccoides]XP_044341167.1 photosystem II reaction center W protein, chloroplastic-like [Triticum aestivum]XP_048544953.1 photosystem II reaction center W protein, chloroplastic-like [Triticum urartu]